MLEGDDPGGRAFAHLLRPHPRAFRQLMCFPPGNFPTFLKKNANARGLAREGGWAVLELTDVSGLLTKNRCQYRHAQFNRKSGIFRLQIGSFSRPLVKGNEDAGYEGAFQQESKGTDTAVSTNFVPQSLRKRHKADL